MDEATARLRSRSRFVATTIGLVVVGLAGYTGYVAFVGSDPQAAAGLMVLAAGTGFAAFFSPCSFPLMLTFLTRRLADSPARALLGAARVAAGAALLLAGVAVIVGLGGSGLARLLRFDSIAGRGFRLGVGLLLVGLGLRQARLWRVNLPWLDRVAAFSARVFDPHRVNQPALRDVVYGFGYLLAGFG